MRKAEVTDDGSIIIEFNQSVYPHTKKAIFTAEALFSLVEDYGEIPEKEDTDFPGVPLVDHEAVYADEK